ncbi:unnamed protein product [Lactuca saligna]|uniref:CCHC-type domain-containing protein n=1 Tax=Lactuca saligna TaxID=75948 RepID=A0AA35Y4W4_LACSI|nr:unnamed protein product [Lactuca saligna]
MISKRTQSSLGESYMSKCVKSKNLLTKKNFGTRVCYRCGNSSHKISECSFDKSSSRAENIKVRNEKWTLKSNSLNCLPKECYNLLSNNFVNDPSLNGQCVEESIHVKFDEESYTVEKVTHFPSIFQELLSCPFENQDIAATSAGNSLSADETLEAEDSPETDNVSVSISPESASVIEHRDHPVDRIIGNIHDGVRTRSSALNNFCIILIYSPMAASLFTYSSTSRRVVPAPNSPPLPIHIKATNVVFNPDIPEVHRGLGLDDFVNFLASCRLRYAISDVPSEFFPEQVYTLSSSPELLSVALRLPIFEPFSEPPTIERCWKFFTGALCKCVGHKSRSGDQLSNYEQQVVCSLLLNKRLDYGALFFDQLVQLLRANVRADHVPFPS